MPAIHLLKKRDVSSKLNRMRYPEAVQEHIQSEWYAGIVMPVYRKVEHESSAFSYDRDPGRGCTCTDGGAEHH
jgi:hypothetical protein